MVEPVKQHFTFEMYAPATYSESGVPVVERVSLQLQGEDLRLQDLIAQFEKFVYACGYKVNGRIDQVEND